MGECVKEIEGFIQTQDGCDLAYRIRRFPQQKPGWFFLTGYQADMTGAKASFLWNLSKETETDCTLFDYFGCGLSSGEFDQGTIGQWKKDALYVLDHLTTGPQVLIGSSMGGWLAFLIGLLRPERFIRLVSIATAPDFTVDILLNSLSDEEKERYEREGRGVTFRGGEPHIIKRSFIEESRDHLLKNQTLSYNFPILMLHGTEDELIPHRYSQHLLERIQSPHTSLTLIQGGDHRLSRQEDFDFLARCVCV